MLPLISTAEAMEALVCRVGFLPLFAGDIPGLSIEEHTHPDVWFDDTRDGPWEWKGPVAKGGHCAYGKLYGKKAGFVSYEWLPFLANHRRDGYDFDARYDDGLASYKDKLVYDTLAAHDSLLSTELKRLCGSFKGFDTSITRLQMQTYITVADFEYLRDKRGNRYGWGIARFAIAEKHHGATLLTSAYGEEPQRSRARIEAHLQKLLKTSDPRGLAKLIG